MRMKKLLATILVINVCAVVGAASQQQPAPGPGTPLNQMQMNVLSLAAKGSGGVRTARLHENNTGARDNSLWAVPLVTLAATRERPIFAPTRRPRPTAIRSSASAISSTQPPFVLVGAIAGENDGVAIFHDGSTKSVIRLKPGEGHAGWILQTVKPREVVLRNDQRTTILTLPGPAAK